MDKDELGQAIAGALARLQPKELGWLVDVAIDGVYERLRAAQDALARERAFPGHPTRALRERSHGERIADHEESVRSYGAMLALLKPLRQRLMVWVVEKECEGIRG